jgi:hypothetical protein
VCNGIGIARREDVIKQVVVGWKGVGEMWDAEAAWK